MDRKLNICLISREYPPDTAFGGIATYSRDTALMLTSRGHKVTVFSQSLTRTHVFDDEGVTVVKMKLPWRLGSYAHLPLFIVSYNIMVMREVMRHHRREPFDVIDVPDHLAEGWLATFSRIPVVTRLHTPYALIVAMGLNNYRQNLSYRLIKALENIALRRSKVLYAPCQDLVARCRRFFNIDSVPVRIFGYPLDLELFSPVRRGDEDTSPFRILFLGRLEHRKGIETIAAAFPKLLTTHPQCTLTLVGSDTPNIGGYPSARAYLSATFDEHNCLSRVAFQSAVRLEELPAILQEHDFVWVPSLYDNFPLVCLEAMACGKVVIVSDAGGLPEMVENLETGMIFPTGDADALAQATAMVLENSTLRSKLQGAARRYVESSCSDEHIYQQTRALYSVALGETGGPEK